MIGPSAPNGPPVPIAIAVESGFNTAIFESMRLCPMRIASIASGMPWPRIFSDPYRAIRPTISPPTTGTPTAQSPSVFPAGEAKLVSKRWKYARFVNSPINRTNASATNALITPTSAAIAASITTRESAVKSPRVSANEGSRGMRGTPGNLITVPRCASVRLVSACPAFCFLFQHGSLPFDPPAIPSEIPVFAHDAVARHHNGDGIRSARPGHGARGFRVSHRPSDLGVGARAPVRDLAQRLPHAPLERRGAHVYRQVQMRLARSEEHTSELQSRGHLVCRLLLEKKKPNHLRFLPANTKIYS